MLLFLPPPTHTHQCVDVQISGELRDSKRQCMDLEDIVESLKRKEQKLLTDQKRRSEAARQVEIKLAAR